MVVVIVAPPALLLLFLFDAVVVINSPVTIRFCNATDDWAGTTWTRDKPIGTAALDEMLIEDGKEKCVMVMWNR